MSKIDYGSLGEASERHGITRLEYRNSWRLWSKMVQAMPVKCGFQGPADAGFGPCKTRKGPASGKGAKDAHGEN